MPIFLACISFIIIYTVLSVKVVNPKLVLETVKTVFGSDKAFVIPERTDIYDENNVQDEQPKEIYLKDIEYPQFNTKYGRISFPSIDREFDLIMGESEQAITDGVATYSRGFIPGYGGTVLSTHNNHVTYLNLMKPGDKIIIKTSYGTYEYSVSEIKIVDKNDKAAMSFENPSTESGLIFFTCYPLRLPSDATQRMVVYADLVSGPKIIK